MKRKIILLLLCAILPFFAILTGCQDTRSKFIFYNPDGSVFEELIVDEGTKPTDADLTASVTIAIGDFKALIEKLAQ